MNDSWALAFFVAVVALSTAVWLGLFRGLSRVGSRGGAATTRMSRVVALGVVIGLGVVALAMVFAYGNASS